MTHKVVSVEDDVEIAELLRIVLDNPEIDLLTADNGRDGLALIRQVKPDLVVLDVMMPEMNGWDVYDEIRADETLKDIPVIVLTVTTTKPDRRKSFAGSPIDLYMSKPFDTLRLRREIERMLGQAGLWQPPKPRVERAFRTPVRTDFVNLPRAEVETPGAPSPAAKLPDKAQMSGEPQAVSDDKKGRETDRPTPKADQPGPDRAVAANSAKAAPPDQSAGPVADQADASAHTPPDAPADQIPPGTPPSAPGDEPRDQPGA